MARRNKQSERDVARERIDTLFELAAEAWPDQERCNRYVELARTIAMRYRIKLRREQKRMFCKHCYAYLRPGGNCRVRINRGRVITRCDACGGFRRIPIHS